MCARIDGTWSHQQAGFWVAATKLNLLYAELSMISVGIVVPLNSTVAATDIFYRSCEREHRSCASV
jgi:hypothetical protein